jgi:hypothetical protein
MVRGNTLTESPKTKVTFTIVTAVFILLLWIGFATDLFLHKASTDSIVKSDQIPDLILGLFRIGAAYLAFHAIVFWMVISPRPGIMYSINYHTGNVDQHEVKGLERLVTFSSWQLILCGIFFFLAGLVSWLTIFEMEIPSFLNRIIPLLYFMALSASSLTAIVVRYVIIPADIKSNNPLGHLFLKHEQVMHNWTIILLSVELIFGSIEVLPEGVILGGFLGGIYFYFAYAWARFFGQYFVYDFIDPRPKSAPFAIVGLVLAFGVFFMTMYALYLVLEWNQWIGVPLVVLFVQRSVLFNPPTN